MYILLETDRDRVLRYHTAYIHGPRPNLHSYLPHSAPETKTEMNIYNFLREISARSSGFPQKIIIDKPFPSVFI